MPSRVVRIAWLVAALRASSATAQSPAGAPAVRFPDTPVGRVIGEWLDTFNSADSARLGAFYRRHGLQRNLAAQMQMRARTGGFELMTIENSQPRLLEYVVRERNSGVMAFGVAELTAADPATLKQSALAPIPAGRTLADFRVDAGTRTRVIDAAIAKLHENYVFPDVATKMAEAVRGRAARGEYDNVTNGLSFAALLTEHFREVSRDRHLNVNFNVNGVPDRRPGGPSPEEQQRVRAAMERDNCGFMPPDTLDRNVGYLKFNFFGEPDVCGPVASKAMNALADVDALIIDLRDNGGGDPAMVAYVSSYLFSERTHLNDIWERPTNRTEEFWTRDVPGRKLGGRKPVYVLTSSRTFSGAEEFTYNLKNLKRATIVGETTGGGAHPVNGHKIDARFTIGVPFARAINPISKTNWEGTGVEPDVKVPAADALDTALRLFTERRTIP